MRWHIRQFLSIARLAAVETVRQPIFLLVSTTCVVLISLLPILITHTLGEAARLVRDSALALQFVCGLILGSYAACSSLRHEIRRGTAAAVLSKPVSRGVFFLAKFAGIAAVMATFSAAVAVSAMLSTRMVSPHHFFDWWAGTPLLIAAPLAYAVAGLRNFVTRRPFVSTAFNSLLLALAAAFLVAAFTNDQGKLVRFGSTLPWNILPAAALIAMATILLAGFALSLAIRFDVVPTLSACSAVFMLGLMSDYLLGRHASQSAVAALLYQLVPNWQHFWAVDALSGNSTIPWTYVGWVGVYAALYLAGILSVGMIAFRQIEVRA